MKFTLLVVVILCSVCSVSGDSISQLTYAAKETDESFVLEKDSAKVQFYAHCNFNSVPKPWRKPFSGYRGIVASTETDLYLVLGKQIPAKPDNVLQIPFSEIETVSHSDSQLQIKCGDFMVVLEMKGSFEEMNEDPYKELAELLVVGGVTQLQPEKEYKLVDTLQPWIGAPRPRPTIFPPSKLDERRAKTRKALEPIHRPSYTYWDPKNW